MLLDKMTYLSDAQAIAAVGATYSEHEVNFGLLKDAFYRQTGLTAEAYNAGEGGVLWLNVTVNTAFVGTTTAATLAVALVHGAATAPTTVKITTPTIQCNAASILKTVGARILAVPLPADLLQYGRLKFTVATTAMTAGKVDAWIGYDTNTPK